MGRSLRAPDPVLDAIVHDVVTATAPLRVVLFGSRARGEGRVESDYDLMVEIEEHRRKEVRAVVDELRRARSWRADIIITTPEEYAAQRDDVGLLAWQIDQDGRLLFTRNGRARGQRVRSTRIAERRRGRPPSVAMWVRRAENDFVMIARALESGDPIPDVATFHAHQAAEKYLKAVIVSTRTPPPRTHDLEALLALCPSHLRASAAMRQGCVELSKMFEGSRYPLDPEPTVQEARHALALASAIRDAARNALGSGT